MRQREGKSERARDVLEVVRGGEERGWGGGENNVPLMQSGACASPGANLHFPKVSALYIFHEH